MPGDLPAHVAADGLFADELVLITALDHPTAGAGALPVAALRDEPFVCLPPASRLRARLEQLAAGVGFAPRIPFESTDLPHLHDLVAHGLGVALLARSVAEAPGRPVAVHQVDPGPLAGLPRVPAARCAGVSPTAASSRRGLRRSPRAARWPG